MDLLDNPDLAFVDDGSIKEGENPFALFRHWLDLAEKSEVNDANAMALATAECTNGAAEGFRRQRLCLLHQ